MEFCMKRVFFPLLAALLALAVFSCNDFTAPPLAEREYTEDGRLMVDLTIGGADRALIPELARAGADFFEVTFYDVVGLRYYRAAWDFTRTGRIRVPVGDYASTTTAVRAILFAGRQSDRTLLAVGLITASNGGSGNADITPSTNQVTFTLSALETSVAAATTSTFKIVGPDPYATADVVAGTFPTARIGLSQYPVPIFRVPKNETGVEAEFVITTTGVAFTNYAPGIRGLPTWTATTATLPRAIFTSGVSATNGDLPVRPLLISAGAITSPPPSGGAVASDGKIEFEFNTPDDDGLSRIALALPVVAISNDAAGGGVHSNPITWYIRGGLENNLLDEGAAARSVGGAILLGIGNINIIDIVVSGP